MDSEIIKEYCKYESPDDHKHYFFHTEKSNGDYSILYCTYIGDIYTKTIPKKDIDNWLIDNRNKILNDIIDG